MNTLGLEDNLSGSAPACLVTLPKGETSEHDYRIAQDRRDGLFGLETVGTERVK